MDENTGKHADHDPIITSPPSGEPDPTAIDRRRVSSGELAAAASGLDPVDGVLTPEMAQHVRPD